MAKKPDASVAVDIAVARRALGLTVGLSGGAHNVAFALLEHFNRKTGQCDPSIARIATMLGLTELTVKRATKELCDVRELFIKRSHGGMSHRSSYAPNWTKLRDIAAEWDGRMPHGSPPERPSEECEGPLEGTANVSELIPSTYQERYFDGIKNDTRTYEKKPIGINPCSDGASGGVRSDTAHLGESTASKAPQADRLAGLWKGQPGQGYEQPSEVVHGGKYRIAQQAAMRRLQAAMMRRGRDTFVRFLEWVTEDISDKATAAEMRRHGDGERFIVERMSAAGLVTSDA